MITLIGLGCSPEDLSEGARAALNSGATVLLRTEQVPVAKTLAEKIPCKTLDGIYATCRNFDTLNKKLAAAVLEEAKHGDVVYCVDGSVAEDVSAQMIIKRHKDVRVFVGVSKADAAFSACKIFSCNRTALSAYSLGTKRPLLPLAIYDIDNDLTAGDVKLRLCELFGDEAPCFFVQGGKVHKIQLYEADRQKEYDSTCVLVLDEIPLLKKTRFDYDDLVEILRLLRAPDGCPWDRVQTHESIRSNMIEEAYELVDAIDCSDDDKIVEETGDVLMQGAFHSVLGEERGAFTPEDVLSGVCNKLIFRHSHIFGEDKATDATEALKVWEKNKREEKGQKNATQTVCDVPKGMPSVMRAQKVGKRAAKFGYDFKNIREASERITEELNELFEALEGGKEEHISEEVGDLLFSAVNVGRLAKVDCEESLRESTQKFVNRLCATEKLIEQDGKKMQDLPAEELWKYYDKVKESHGNER